MRLVTIDPRVMDQSQGRYCRKRQKHLSCRFIDLVELSNRSSSSFTSILLSEVLFASELLLVFDNTMLSTVLSGEFVSLSDVDWLPFVVSLRVWFWELSSEELSSVSKVVSVLLDEERFLLESMDVIKPETSSSESSWFPSDSTSLFISRSLLSWTVVPDKFLNDLVIREQFELVAGDFLLKGSPSRSKSVNREFTFVKY